MVTPDVNPTRGLNTLRAALLLPCLLVAATPAYAADLTRAQRTTEGLRSVARELNDSLKRYRTHLDETIAAQDSGVRLPDGTRIQAADADIKGGPPELMRSAIARFTAFRVLASRDDHFHPALVFDFENIQRLIAE